MASPLVWLEASGFYYTIDAGPSQGHPWISCCCPASSWRPCSFGSAGRAPSQALADHRRGGCWGGPAPSPGLSLGSCWVGQPASSPCPRHQGEPSSIALASLPLAAMSKGGAGSPSFTPSSLALSHLDHQRHRYCAVLPMLFGAALPSAGLRLVRGRGSSSALMTSGSALRPPLFGFPFSFLNLLPQFGAIRSSVTMSSNT